MIVPFLLNAFSPSMAGIYLLSAIHSVHVGGGTVTAAQTVWIRPGLFQSSPLSQVTQDSNPSTKPSMTSVACLHVRTFPVRACTLHPCDKLLYVTYLRHATHANTYSSTIFRCDCGVLEMVPITLEFRRSVPVSGMH